LERLQRWEAFQATAPPAILVSDATLGAIAKRARGVLPNWLCQLVPWLEPWLDRPVPVHPCLCDVWHDHVLFEGDRVGGIIDYGAVKVDHTAVDLARMLGSLVEDDKAAWHVGLKAYRSVRPFGEEEERLAHVLDVTGAVVGVLNWLMRIAVEKRTEEDQGKVARRLETLVKRLERWEKNKPLAAEW
jgi:homoserine kinase type II